jgi:hypothetical protein
MKGPEGLLALLPPRPWITLAPMAGYTDHPYRILCKEGGADFVCTELLSATALHYGNAKTFTMMDWTEEERPVGCQIFGAEPEFMAEAAYAVRQAGCDVVDINLGCSVPKVLRTGASAALCRDLSVLRPVGGDPPVPRPFGARVSAAVRVAEAQDDIRISGVNRQKHLLKGEVRREK